MSNVYVNHYKRLVTLHVTSIPRGLAIEKREITKREQSIFIRPIRCAVGRDAINQPLTLDLRQYTDVRECSGFSSLYENLKVL